MVERESVSSILSSHSLFFTTNDRRNYINLQVAGCESRYCLGCFIIPKRLAQDRAAEKTFLQNLVVVNIFDKVIL
jgi:hypothetical protein